MFTSIILSFIGWFLMYFGLCFLDKLANYANFEFWYIKPENWLNNAVFYWFLTFIFVLVFI